MNIRNKTWGGDDACHHPKPLRADTYRPKGSLVSANSYLFTHVFSHPRGDPADLLPAQRGVCRGCQRIPRIHQSVLPPSLRGAAPVRWMLQQRGLLLHQHESLACQQDSEWISLLLVLFLPCFFSFQHFVVLVPFSCYTKLDGNQSTQLRNALICITSHPAAVGHSLAATGQEFNMIQSRTVAQSCNHYINFFTHQRKHCEEKQKRSCFISCNLQLSTPLTFIFSPRQLMELSPPPKLDRSVVIVTFVNHTSCDCLPKRPLHSIIRRAATDHLWVRVTHFYKQSRVISTVSMHL